MAINGPYWILVLKSVFETPCKRTLHFELNCLANCVFGVSLLKIFAALAFKRP
jgi:hypothetical protein